LLLCNSFNYDAIRKTNYKYRTFPKAQRAGGQKESFWAWYEATDRDDTPRLSRFDEHCSVCTLPKQPWEEKYSAFTVAELGFFL
jgi:hypothetical protein